MVHFLPPVNPTPILYLRVEFRDMWICGFVPWVMWEMLTGVKELPCWGLLWHMLANRALVYPIQGGRYCPEGCMALGQWQQCCERSSWGTRPHPIVCRTYVHVGLPGWGPYVPPILWEGSLTGDSDRYKWTIKPLALDMEHLFLLGEDGGGYLTGNFEGKVS